MGFCSRIRLGVDRVCSYQTFGLKGRPQCRRIFQIGLVTKGRSSPGYTCESQSHTQQYRFG